MEKGLSYQRVDDGFMVRLPKGSPVMTSLVDFLSEKHVYSGTLQAIGALQQIELGYFDLAKKTYLRKSFPGIYELVSFTGNINLVDEKPFIHAHAILSDANFIPIAGHFFDATVAVTMEVHISPVSQKISREIDPETELKLLKLTNLL